MIEKIDEFKPKRLIQNDSTFPPFKEQKTKKKKATNLNLNKTKLYGIRNIINLYLFSTFFLFL